MLYLRFFKFPSSWLCLIWCYLNLGNTDHCITIFYRDSSKFYFTKVKVRRTRANAPHSQWCNTQTVNRGWCYFKADEGQKGVRRRKEGSNWYFTIRFHDSQRTILYRFNQYLHVEQMNILEAWWFVETLVHEIVIALCARYLGCFAQGCQSIFRWMTWLRVREN